MSKTQNEIERILQGGFAESGWDGLESTAGQLTKEQQHANESKRFESAMEIARPFMTPDGKLALACLKQRTLDAPTWDPEAAGAMEGAAAGFAREGQNSIIRFIDTCITIAMAGPPKPMATAEE